MDSKREAIVAKIRALMAKTVENGATEAEAKAAAGKVDELMQAYAIEITETEIKQGNIIQIKLDNPSMRPHAVQKALSGIGVFCDCKWWMHSNGAYGYTVFGDEADARIAEYLYYLFMRAIDQESRNYGLLDFEFAQLTGRQQNDARNSFAVGMGDRLSERLCELKSKRDFTVKERTGKELVVVKRAVVDEAFAKAGIKLGASPGVGGPSRKESYEQGRAKAEKVAIHQGVRAARRGQLT